MNISLHMNDIETCDTTVRTLVPMIQKGGDRPYATVSMKFRDGDYNSQEFTFFMEFVTGRSDDQASNFVKMLRSVADQIESSKDQLSETGPDDISGNFGIISVDDHHPMGYCHTALI